MKPSFLERRGPFGITHALLILLVFFFLLPSAFQSARLSLKDKENDIKDWLPGEFPETAELEWFASHFAGESFVLATWPGCNVGDQRLELFEEKLRHESDQYDAADGVSREMAEAYRRARQTGIELGLMDPGQQFNDWGGQREKWLTTPGGQWFYITPDGRLYRWEEPANGPMALVRAIKRSLGRFELKGKLVTAFRIPAEDEAINPFYNDLSLLCAPLFDTVQTGTSIAAELSQEGGALWPVDLTDESKRAEVARQRAMERLTGTMFAPAVPPGFTWTPQAFRQVLSNERQAELPEQFSETVKLALEQWLQEKYDGDLDKLIGATNERQAEAWYHVFDRLQIEPPPRQTCVLVTLTPLAQDNLAFALGRGLLGGPRGRLLVLAEESGLRAPPPPSVAPPPFDRPDPDAVVLDHPAEAAGPPPLRMGGPPVDNIAIDEEGTVTLVRLVGYSVLIGIVLSYLCFWSIKITVMVFLVGGSAAMLSMAIVGWADGRVDAILMSMPSLVYVLGLSGAIHVVNYYRDEVRVRGEPGAPSRALRHALMPCTLASLTTAIGLVSLFTSNLAPISNFGLFAAIGVIATLAILFSYLPAALQVFRPMLGHGSTSDRDEPKESPLARWWARVGGFVAGHHLLVSGVCLIVLAAVAVGIRKVETSVQLLKLFDEDARIIADYTWLERNFGKLVPMEVVVRVPPRMQRDGESDGESVPAVEALTLLERAELAARIRTVVERTLGEGGRDVVGHAMSTDTFLPPLPEPSAGYSATRSLMNRRLLDSKQLLRDNDYLQIEKRGPYAGSELWRISLRVAALSDVDYGNFIRTLRDTVEPVMRAYDTRDQLLGLLEEKRATEPRRNRTSPSVLVVGGRRPEPLEEANLLAEDGVAINTRQTFLSTLGELLRGEPIRRPLWVDIPAEKVESTVGNETWNDTLKQFDVVIWVGGEGLEATDFAAAPAFIDAMQIQQRTVRPIVLPDRIPDVQNAGSLQVVYTGVVPVVYKAQRTLLTSLSHSIGLAFILIAIVMAVLLNPGRFPLGFFRPKNLLNGVLAAAVSMIPNLFPVLLVFGAMGHLGTLVGIGTMMTASVAMGVAVDDTIHFLSWFRTYLDQGLSRVEAVIETYRRVGPAMTQTTIVGGLGLFVFSLSTFVPTQRFGSLMLVLLATALVGDLILLPALLAGPLGHFFKPRESGTTSASTEYPEPEPEDDSAALPPGAIVRIPPSATDQATPASPIDSHDPPAQRRVDRQAGPPRA